MHPVNVTFVSLSQTCTNDCTHQVSTKQIVVCIFRLQPRTLKQCRAKAAHPSFPPFINPHRLSAVGPSSPGAGVISTSCFNFTGGLCCSIKECGGNLGNVVSRSEPDSKLVRFYLWLSRSAGVIFRIQSTWDICAICVTFFFTASHQQHLTSAHYSQNVSLRSCVSEASYTVSIFHKRTECQGDKKVTTRG